MPKPVYNEDVETPQRVDELDAFASRLAWRRSQRGNLWREWRGATLTIFRRSGRFAWCIAREGGETQFSRTGYEDEQEALGALTEELEIGGYV